MIENKSTMNPEKEELVCSGKVLCPIHKEAKSLMASMFHLMYGILLYSLTQLLHAKDSYSSFTEYAVTLKRH